MGPKIKTGFMLYLIPLLFYPLFLLAESVPSPKEIFGFEIGADYHLATYTEAREYLHLLQENSKRIKVFEMGKTSMGQIMEYAVISSEDNLKDLEKFKAIMKKLSLVEGLSPQEAMELAEEGKAVVYIDGGLHASECAPAQHLIQLAYNLVTAKEPRLLKILDEVILILVFANPDGMNLLAEWYHPNVGTPYEVSPMPWLYHLYAGHDNNRDSYIANLIETQNISRLVLKEWHPLILYNHHQTAPFPARIWIPPNSEPTNPNVHPLIIRWQNLIGSAMGATFDAEGKEGAISRIVFDTWFPGYVTQVVDSHNIISILTETALYRYATPHFYTIRDFPEEYKDLTMSAFYPSPWKGGWWRLKDAVEYCLTASMAVLDVASKYRKELLFNKYRMGKDVIEKFKKEPPFAWIIPESQRDPSAMSLLLNRMILLGIHAYSSNESFKCDGIHYPAGTYIIPMAQPFAFFIKNMFEEQRYPDLRNYPDLWQGIINPKKFEGAPFEAYDMMGWTLPYQFGVEVTSARTPLNPNMTLVEEIKPREGKITGNPGYAYLLNHEENTCFSAINRILNQKGKILWAKSQFKALNKSFSPGTIIVLSSSVQRSFMEKLAKDLHLEIFGVGEHPEVGFYELKKIRTGLYKSWVPTPDEGWTRFILEKFEFPYFELVDSSLQAGSLKKNYDVIIIPDHYSPEAIIEGYPKGTIPPQYSGGMTAKGVRNLKQFVEEGGTLIFLNSSSNLAIDCFELPVQNVLKKLEREEFVCEGSILRMQFDVSHPIASGMPAVAGTIFSRSCAFEILPSFTKERCAVSIAKYPDDNLLMSGWIHGEQILREKSSLIEARYGKGKIILLGFPVQFRAQPYGTFKLLFNSIFYAGLE